MTSISESVLYVSDVEMAFVKKETNSQFDDFYGGYVVSCKDIPKFSDIVITIGNESYNISAYDYVGLVSF